jgi:MFS family permease
VDIAINGSFWLGSILGSLAALLFLDKAIFAADVGWRLAFGLGAFLGVGILIVRRHVPESPRWLFIHGRGDEAEALVKGVEDEVGEGLEPADKYIEIHQRKQIGFGQIAGTLIRNYPKRAGLGLALFIGQAFLYNAITFGYAQILQTFFQVPPGSTGYYFAVIAVGNLAGPLLLAHLFDSLGRKIMITSTYVGSGVLLLVTAWLFHAGALNAVTMTVCWCVVLFFASAGASSAYLTVSEIFPMETRALAIAFFYAIGTAAGGITGPLLFAHLVGTGKVGDTVVAFVIGAALMILAGLVELVIGVKAERQSLEDLATPLSAAETVRT